ncbi:unnamed protein product [Adineta steineri]|uniref:G-protein coupled receptors family 1 profile domain-containing protein n=1 Tax=Adineta steineri TaxID=433720 RepID=A0A819DHB8_9BILA|nr:unnamed protein product [Adineta steineri]
MDIIILILVSIGSITSIGILSLMFYRRRQYPINTSSILICNTYLAIILSCLTLLDMYAYNLYGLLHENIVVNNWWCYGRIYLLDVGTGSLYFSCLLKACFRLFSIVFYKNKRLQSFQFALQIVILQWIIVFLLLIYPLVLQYYTYTSNLYQCQLPFTNFKAVMSVSTILFFIPMSSIGLIYCYIMYYIKHRTSTLMQQNRERSYQRDVVVLRRIIILVTILAILSSPTIALWMYYIVTNYLAAQIYHIQWLIHSVSLLILSIALVFLNSELQKLLSISLRQNRRIQPAIIMQQQRLKQSNET